LAGGLLGAHLGMGSVFLGTAALLATCSAVVVRGQRVKKHRNEGF
jgi:hypothetical protein